MKYPQSIDNLIEQFAGLPTVGRKTAERFVFYLLKSSPEKLRVFAQSLENLKTGLTTCTECLSPSTTNPCAICADKSRRNDLLCLVANFQDLISLENTKQYSGRYFVLGGLINTIENISPDDLNIRSLVEKLNIILKNKKDIEIILAFNPTLEGETTAMYLAKILKNPHLKITRLARGLPMGANLEYADELTLANALKYRNLLS